MIPDLPEGISDENILDFYDKLAGNLQDQSTIHVNWFTHRRNPSVCWICDLNILLTKVLALTDTNITKSTVDLETTSMSEDETESESEKSLIGFTNYNEEPEEKPNEPEFDTEEPL